MNFVTQKENVSSKVLLAMISLLPMVIIVANMFDGEPTNTFHGYRTNDNHLPVLTDSRSQQANNHKGYALDINDKTISLPEYKESLKSQGTNAQWNKPVSREKALAYVPDLREGNVTSLISFQKASVSLLTDQENKNVYIEELGITELPLLPEELQLVTPGNIAYRLTGLCDEQIAMISLPFDSKRISEGYSVSDIRTYRYDDQLRQWEELAKDGVDPEKNLLYARTKADGIMINAIIKSPELPQTEVYTPTKIKDLKLADPGANIQMIASPTANQQGTAQLSYQIEVPRGRLGLQPDLTITYNSDGGNGLMGEGWDLNVQRITVETRWGVPDYDSDFETETYLLNGEMLAFEADGITTTAHRSLNKPRQADRRFYPRKQNQFNKIIRHGNGPKNYWWEITDRKGTKYLYGKIKQWAPEDGGTTTNRSFTLISMPGSLLKDDDQDIAEWRLTYVEDVHGNFMRFDYEVGEKNYYSQKAKYVRIKTVRYTGYNNVDRKKGSPIDPNYHVNFLYDDQDREDLQVSGRYGFLSTQNGSKLKSIDVVYFRNRNEQVNALVRSYRFNYSNENFFRKTLLTRISQYGEDNSEFNHHDFEYYDELKDGKVFEDEKKWKTTDVRLNTELKRIPGLANTKPTALGGNKSQASGYTFYGGFGFNDRRFINRSATGGVQFGVNNSYTQGLNTLIDIDGDGLPDKVFFNNGMFYHKNEGDGFSENAIPIRGIQNFYEERSYTNSVAVSASFSRGTVSRESGKTSTDINTYFSDVNADGLIDVVKNGKVFFNKLVNGTPHFSPDNNNPSFMKPSGQITLDESKEDYTAKTNELSSDNPLHDVVRIWQAPFDGKIKVDAPVTMIRPTTFSYLEALDTMNLDGIMVTVQLDKNELWRQFINSNDFGQYNLPESDFNNLAVKKDQKLFFRVSSGINNHSNGTFDLVKWSPRITYVEENYLPLTEALKNRRDVFGQDLYSYSVANDSLFSNEAGIQIPKDTTVVIDLNLSKVQTSDDVKVEIIELSENTDDPVRDFDGNIVKEDGKIVYKFSKPSILYDTLLKANQTYNFNGTNDTLIKSLKKDALYLFKISSDVNTNYTAVQWEPSLYIPKPISNESAQVTYDTIYAIPYFDFKGEYSRIGKFWSAYDTQSYKIKPYVTFHTDSLATDSIWFTIRNSEGLLYKQKLHYNRGNLLNAQDTMFKFNESEEVYSDFETDFAFAYLHKKKRVENLKDVFYIVDDFTSFKAKIQNKGNVFFTVPRDGEYLIKAPLLFKANVKWDIEYEVLLDDQLKKSGTLKFDDENLKIIFDTLVCKRSQKILVKFSRKPLPTSIPAIPPLDTLELNSYDVFISEKIPAQLWNKGNTTKFGPMFRNWGQFVYNPEKGRNGGIDTSKLHNPRVSKAEQKTLRKEIDKQSHANYNGEVNAGPLKTLDVKNAEFSKLVPVRTRTMYQWKGMDDDIYINKELQRSSRAGINHVVVSNPFIQEAELKPSVRAVIKRYRSNYTSYSAGFGLGISEGSNSSYIESEYIDFNGDNFPDIVSSSQAQLTIPDGSLGQKKLNIKTFHESKNKTSGKHISGSSFLPSNGSSSTYSPGYGSSVKSTTQNGISASASTKEASSSFTPSFAYSNGKDETKSTWMDVNGDGLPDKIEGTNKVELNLGTKLSSSFTMSDIPYINEGSNISLSPGLNLGFNNGNSSISGGVGVSLGRSLPERQLLDLNGDGLIDRIKVTGADLEIGINKGRGFELVTVSSILNEEGRSGFPNQIDNNKWNTSFNASAGSSLGGTFTYGFPLPLPAPPFPLIFKMAFTTGINKSNGLGTTLRQFYDLNGDGFADYLYSTNYGELKVRLSRIGASNKLKTVKGPLGANFTVEYKHNKATQEHPGGKWVMHSVTVNDGVAEDRASTAATYDFKKIFTYNNGFFNRYEREFSGFGEVMTEEIDFNGNVLRRSIRSYHNGNYYTAGNLAREVISDGQGNKYLETENKYYAFPNAMGENLVDTNVPSDFDGVVFAPVKYSVNKAYEGLSEGIVLNQSYCEYDALGNNTLFRYSIKGRLDSTDQYRTYDYQVRKTYEPIDPTSGIFGLLSHYSVSNDTAGYREGKATYYKSGQLKEEIITLSPGEFAVTNYEYDGFGNITLKTLPDGFTYQYKYETNVQSYVNEVTDKHGYGTKQEQYNLKYGIPTRMVDANRATITYELDKYGRTVRIWSPLKSTSHLSSIEIKYDPLNKNHAEIIHRDDTCNVAACGVKIHSYTDGLNRVIQTKKNAVITAGNGNVEPEKAWVASGKMSYDALGRVVRQYYPAPDNNKALNLNLKPQITSATIHTYDLLDRRTGIVLLDTVKYLTQSHSISDNRLAVNTILHSTPDTLSQVKSDYLDGSGQLIRSELKRNNGQHISTRFEYDAIHQLRAVIDDNGNKLEKQYDMAGRVVQSNSPDKGSIGMEYDVSGNLTKKILPDGESITYTYNHNQLETISYSGNKSNNVRYIYGASTAGTSGTDNTRLRNAYGRLLFKEDATGTEMYTYDPLGNIIKTERTIVVPFDTTYTFVTEFNYDSWNRLLSIKYPDEESVNYRYNEAGELSKITSSIPSKQAYVENIGYDEFGNRSYLEYGNGVKIGYQYDERRRLERLSTQFTGTAGSFEYDYDNQNNLVSVSNRYNNIDYNQHYKYNEIGQLYKADGSWSNSISYHQEFSYDNCFNIIQNHLDLQSDKIKRSVHLDYKIATNSNQIESVRELSNRINSTNPGLNKFYEEQRSFTYQFDKKGNIDLLSEGDEFAKRKNVNRREMLYDEENRISAIALNGFVSNYLYDDQGERVIKVSSQTDNVFVNGILSGETIRSSGFLLYVNPYYSTRNGSALYTKHIYIGSQRIASELSTQNSRHTTVECDKNRHSPKCSQPVLWDQKLKNSEWSINASYTIFDLPQKDIDQKNFFSGIRHRYDQENKPESSASGKPADTIPGLRYFYHTNQVNSVNFISNKEGKVVQHIEYLPYGQTFMEERGAYSSQFSYTGKEHDRESGLIYFGARYFDPKMGNWLSVDPMEDKYHGKSPYNYSLGNPVKYYDPDGNDVEINRYGTIIGFYNYPGLNVTQNGKRIGSLGSTIYANDFYSNLVRFNVMKASKLHSELSFYFLVKNKGDWDLKNDQNSIIGFANKFPQKATFLFDGLEMTAPDLGNHHFGVTGKATGFFSEELMLRAAGLAQIKAGTSRPEYGFFNPPYGDDPQDQLMIMEGFNYFERIKLQRSNRENSEWNINIPNLH